MSEHSRFLHIERRRDDDADPGETADRARIAAVLDGAPPSRAPGDHAADAGGIELAVDAPAGTDAIARPAEAVQEIDDVPEIEMAIDVSKIEGQPFVRCARCGRDNTIHARECDNCAAALDTAAQRAFNDKLWNVQRARSEKEREALAEMAALREEQRRNTLRPLPEPGMAPPPELTEAMGPDDGPFLIEVLRALQKKEWRWATAAAMVVVPLFLVTLGGAILSRIGWGIVVLLVLAMLPRRLGRRLFDAWFGTNSPR